MIQLLAHPSHLSEVQAMSTGVDDVKPTTETAPRCQIGQFTGGQADAAAFSAQVFASADRRLVIVADALGGASHQHDVSRAVVTSLKVLGRRLKPPLTVEQIRMKINLALVQTNARLVALAREDGRHKCAGASVVLAVRIGSQLVVKAVGDCRAYLWRNHDFTALTMDHTLAELLVSTSGRLRPSDMTRPAERIVLRHLGQHDYLPNDDFCVLNLAPDDRVLLCTRGVTESVPDTDLAGLIGNATTAGRAARATTTAALSGHARHPVAGATLFSS